MASFYPEIKIPYDLENFISNPIPKKPKAPDLPNRPNFPQTIDKDDGIGSFYLIFFGVGFLFYLTQAIWLLFTAGFIGSQDFSGE